MASCLPRDNGASAKHAMRKKQLSKCCEIMKNSVPNPPQVLDGFGPAGAETKGRQMCKEREQPRELCAGTAPSRTHAPRAGSTRSLRHARRIRMRGSIFCATLPPAFKRSAAIASPADARAPAQVSSSASRRVPHAAEAPAFLQPSPNSHLALMLSPKRPRSQPRWPCTEYQRPRKLPRAGLAAPEQ